MPTEIPFYKFDGAGNDFILIDARHDEVQLTEKQIAHLCHRRFGIGADGLMTLHHAEGGFDFLMRYYNSDGREATMCGNGGRCITVFAKMMGVESTPQNHFRFIGPDGEHSSDIIVWNEDAAMGIVRLAMRDIESKDIKKISLPFNTKDVADDRNDGDEQKMYGWYLNTGSPHLVIRVANLDDYDVVSVGRWLRYRTELFPEGTNVDFIEDKEDGTLAVRTYERGVEDETMACGTGVTACAIVTGNGRIKTRGGDFRVTFDVTGDNYSNVMLTGPVAFNFHGMIKLDIQ